MTIKMTINKQILQRQCDSAKEALFPNETPLFRRLYAGRAMQSAKELDRSLDQLLPFHALLGIDQAASLLVAAISQKKRILIVGDFDADGATSAALAVRALKSFGADHVDFLVPNRFAFGYGLTPELVAVAKDYAPDIIVTVDNGIANHAGVDAAKALGITVIITDHHLPGLTLPSADAIVNPNQPNDPFPSKCLAGVGVIFYVMLACRRALQEKGWFESKAFLSKQLSVPNMARFLDLVALGTVADLVPLDHNNRVLVYHGLKRMRQGQCVLAIVALLECANRDLRQVTAADLGFAVASRLNAAGRLDDMSVGIQALLCDDSVTARHMAKTLDTLNHERRVIENEMQTQALHTLETIEQNMSQTLPVGLCLFDETYHQGVIGIVASRLKERFNRPVIVFAKGSEGELKGSARSIPQLHIRDALQNMNAQHPSLILKFGGHAMAAGLTIKATDFQLFSQIFNDIVTATVPAHALQHTIISDGALSIDELTLEIAYALREAGPWGQAFPEPLFDDAFEILDQQLLGEKHLKLRLAKGNKHLDAIAFFVDPRLWPNYRCRSLHAAYRLAVNEYKGRSNVQLILEYLEPLE